MNKITKQGYSFTQEQWDMLVDIVSQMFGLVAAADGKVGFRESLRFSMTMEDNIFGNKLMSIIADEVNDNQKYFVDRAQNNFLKSGKNVDAVFSNVSSILDEVLPPQHAHEFKCNIIGLGIHIAEASGGGFLGRKDPICDEEKAIITRIAKIFGVYDELYR
jgi:hypothetical protein